MGRIGDLISDGLTGQRFSKLEQDSSAPLKITLTPSGGILMYFGGISFHIVDKAEVSVL